MKTPFLFSFSFILLLLVSATFAGQNAAENIQKALGGMCAIVQSSLAIGMLMLVVIAALVYAVGQVLGAETRARAAVWATAMFIGAIIGALIYILMPVIISQLMTGEGNSEWVQKCCRVDPETDCLGLAGGS